MFISADSCFWFFYINKGVFLVPALGLDFGPKTFHRWKFEGRAHNGWFKCCNNYCRDGWSACSFCHAESTLWVQPILRRRGSSSSYWCLMQTLTWSDGTCIFEQGKRSLVCVDLAFYAALKVQIYLLSALFSIMAGGFWYFVCHVYFWGVNCVGESADIKYFHIGWQCIQVTTLL